MLFVGIVGLGIFPPTRAFKRQQLNNTENKKWTTGHEEEKTSAKETTKTLASKTP